MKICFVEAASFGFLSTIKFSFVCTKLNFRWLSDLKKMWNDVRHGNWAF